MYRVISENLRWLSTEQLMRRKISKKFTVKPIVVEEKYSLQKLRGSTMRQILLRKSLK